MTHTISASVAPIFRDSRALASTSWYEPLLDRALIPDVLIRAGIRARLRAQIVHEERGSIEDRHERFRTFLAELRTSPIAIQTRLANEQHYELPADFFRLCLGPRLKYSGCLFPPGVATLAQAEEAMLNLTCQRARVRDGMSILDLGCGWGSLYLWIAEKFPRCRITAVSNSRPQREFILAEPARRGLHPPEVITADMNDFALDRRFDRVLSVEMFEHMKNYPALLARVAAMMAPDALLFVHIFTHTRIAYHFRQNDDWIGRYFFSGGTMPSDHLMHYFQDDLNLIDHWRVDGRHYEKTANNWLANLDARHEEAVQVLSTAYGRDAQSWCNRWRVFFMACAELWGLHGGEEWIVSHYLWSRKDPGRALGASEMGTARREK